MAEEIYVLPEIRNKIVLRIVGNHVTHTPPTERNRLGQSGLHTLRDDLQDVFEEHICDESTDMGLLLEDLFLLGGKARTYPAILHKVHNYLCAADAWMKFTVDMHNLCHRTENDHPAMVNRAIHDYFVPPMSEEELDADQAPWRLRE